MSGRTLLKLWTWRGVPVYVHWSALVVMAFILVTGAVEAPLKTIAASLSYFAMLLIHEMGHQIAATRRGVDVYSIDVYALHGRCMYEETFVPLNNAKIAWGGVVAQWIVAIPFIAANLIFGYTRFAWWNSIVAVLGFISPTIAVFNLLPIWPLDGANAWKLFPILWRRRRHLRGGQ